MTLRQKLVPEKTLNESLSQKISRGAERLSGLMFEVELSKLKLLDGVNLFKACCRRPFTVSLFLSSRILDLFFNIYSIFVFNVLTQCVILFNL